MKNELQIVETRSPIACNLPDREQTTRGDELQDLLSGVEEEAELADGWAYRFPGSEDWMTRLADFIRFERKCCPFLTFELVFAPDNGPVWLRLRGPEGTKEWLKEMS